MLNVAFVMPRMYVTDVMHVVTDVMFVVTDAMSSCTVRSDEGW